jgi:hypothetical protein
MVFSIIQGFSESPQLVFCLDFVQCDRKKLADWLAIGLAERALIPNKKTRMLSHPGFSKLIEYRLALAQ